LLERKSNRIPSIRMPRLELDDAFVESECPLVVVFVIGCASSLVELGCSRIAWNRRRAGLYLDLCYLRFVGADRAHERQVAAGVRPGDGGLADGQLALAEDLLPFDAIRRCVRERLTCHGNWDGRLDMKP